MQTISKTEWTMRFAGRLRRISLNAGGNNAMLAAELTYPDAADLEPEEAAESYASEHVSDDPGAPGD